jgi:DNA-binding SARP family transcriptional activator
LFTLGCIYVNTGRAEQAIATFQRALDKDAYLEEAHLELIRCYAQLNQRGQALRQYEILTQVLAELEVTPSPEVQALIERLRHNQPL